MRGLTADIDRGSDSSWDSATKTTVYKPYTLKGHVTLVQVPRCEETHSIQGFCILKMLHRPNPARGNKTSGSICCNDDDDVNGEDNIKLELDGVLCVSFIRLMYYISDRKWLICLDQIGTQSISMSRVNTRQNRGLRRLRVIMCFW